MTQPHMDVEQRFRAFMSSKRAAFSFLGHGPSTEEFSAQLRDLRVQAAAIEAQLQTNEDAVLLAHVRRRFGDVTADAVRKAAESKPPLGLPLPPKGPNHVDALTSTRAAPGAATGNASAADALGADDLAQSGGAGSGRGGRKRSGKDGKPHTWEVGLAAAAGGTALLVLTSGIPVLAIGVGLILVGGGGAATASQWRKRRTRAMSTEATLEEVEKWRQHVAVLQERLSRSEAHCAAAVAPSQLSGLSIPGLPGDHGVPDLSSFPIARTTPGHSWNSSGPALPTGVKAAVAAGIPVPPAPARAANGHSKELVLPQIPHPLRKAFAQVQVAMRTGPESWRLRACYGAARLLEHVHGGGQAPLCAYKAIVQVDAPPRSVRKMVLDLKEGRRLWDQTFENGNCVDTLTATSDIAHIVLAPVSSILSAFGSGHAAPLTAPLLAVAAMGAERDVVVWRHWVPLPPDLATANPTAEGVSSSAGAGTGGNGYIIVAASTTHAGRAPVPGYTRAHCLIEAWVITPVAFSVRSEVTHFCAYELGGAVGAFANIAPSLLAALHRPYYERLGSLALHATALHGCLAVPLPRRQKREGGGNDNDSDAGTVADEEPAGRTFDPTTGLANDVFNPVNDVEWQLHTTPNVGGVNGFSQPHAEIFRVRSKNYLADRVKLPTAPAALDIAAVYAFRTHHVTNHIAAAPDSPLHRWRAQGTMPPFTLVLNMQVAGSPGFQGIFFFAMNEEEWSVHKAVVAAAAAGAGPPKNPNEAFHRLLANFVKPDFSPAANRFRDERLKLLPAIVQGPMLLKNSSGNRPAILGNKLKQSYYAGPGYFEIDVDCGYNRAAASVVNMVKGYCKTLVIDLAFILEGKSEAELPERVLGVIRFLRVDIDRLNIRPHSDEVPPMQVPTGPPPPQ